MSAFNGPPAAPWFDVTMAQDQPLPEGCSWGAHCSGPGWEGYFLQAGGRWVTVRLRPDLSPSPLEEVKDLLEEFLGGLL